MDRYHSGNFFLIRNGGSEGNRFAEESLKIGLSGPNE